MSNKMMRTFKNETKCYWSFEACESNIVNTFSQTSRFSIWLTDNVLCLGYDFGECDDEEEDDPDALQDPIYQKDLQVSSKNLVYSTIRPRKQKKKFYRRTDSKKRSVGWAFFFFFFFFCLLA